MYSQFYFPHWYRDYCVRSTRSVSVPGIVLPLPPIKIRLSSFRWTHQFRCFSGGLGQEAVFRSVGERRPGCHLLLRQRDLNCECVLGNVCTGALHGGAFCFPQHLKELPWPPALGSWPLSSPFSCFEEGLGQNVSFCPRNNTFWTLLCADRHVYM